MRFISKTPGGMGGSAYLHNTRISVWILVEARAAGATDASLLQDSPGLTQAALEAAWAYFARGHGEIMADIQANKLA